MSYKHIIIVLLIAGCVNGKAQNRLFDYHERWRKIDSLVSKKGLIQSALLEVNNVYAYSKKEGNNTQLIKALLYRINLRQARNEDAEKSSIRQLEEEMSSVKEPSKSILRSVLAETYWDYLQQNRSKFYDRTATVNFKKEDIDTWGGNDFRDKISGLYLSSVSNEKILQQTKLEPFDAIIIKGNVRYLRPTLFDLLAHRALEYFKNDEQDIDRPAYAFEIDNPLVFADEKTFAAYHFVSQDSMSLHFKALRLFQELISFHINDVKPDALIDADIERLTFLSQYAAISNKDELYYGSLEKITAKFPDEPAAAQAWYLQASQYAYKAAQYEPLTDTANRFAYLRAKWICEKVVAEKDSSEGKAHCENLLRLINKKELNVQLEKVNVPNMPFRVLLSYRNFSKLYFRIIKTPKTIMENLGNQWEDGYWKRITQLSAYKTFQELLSETGDFQKHSTEIKIDSLPVGEYALIASADENFSLQKNPMVVAFFYVSDIAYINNGSDYFVLNRETGQPVARASVQAWYRYYDARYSKYLERKGENFTTDRTGFFTISPFKNNNNDQLKLEFTSVNDHLFIDDNGYQYAYRNGEETPVSKYLYEKNNLKTFFFIDRAIYRPGQTLYFKGLVITRDFDSKQPRIISSLKTKVFLYDANGEKVDSVFVTTNDFGSYNGRFRLPENLLNGEFKIADDSTESEQVFSVEEYKRPKFYMEYDKLKGAYRINDSINVTGFAKAYSGNNIDGARVKYRVVRQSNFPYPWLYSRWGMPKSSAQEIMHGEVKTNADGKFSIKFAAIPDKSVKKELQPVFDYTLTADVTDANGETRSGTTQVAVGYKSLNLSIGLPYTENLVADSLKNIFIKTKNLSGEFEPSKVDVVIYKLKSPDRLIRQRYWQQPDEFVMSKEEYLKYFPNDEYSDETKKETWEKEAKVFDKVDSTKESSAFTIDHSPFTPGWYVIEATAKDRYGEEVKNIKYVQLFDSKTGNPVTPVYNWPFDNYHNAEPGKKVIVHVGSSAKDVFVIENIEGRNQHTEVGDSSSKNYSFFNLSGEKSNSEFNINESDRGGFGVFYAFVKDNRFYSGNNTVSVPWTNKELNISYETYRDKTLPGSEEKWKVKISGYKKDKTAAEVLTAMYDASLDQFKKQGWEKPAIYVNPFRQGVWNNTSDFCQIISTEKYFREYAILFHKNYDQLFSQKEINNLKYSSRMMLMAKPDEEGEATVRKELSGVVTGIVIRGNSILKEHANSLVVIDGIVFKGGINDLDPDDISNIVVLDSLASASIYGTQGANGALIVTTKKAEKKQKEEKIQIRKNLNETAFFFPDLKTDSSGSVEFSFTMPEALTQWKWMMLAHTKDLSFGYSEKSVITQKQLMVQPNVPRFLREGDHIYLTAKIVNLTDSEFTGQVELQLFDATTNQPVDGWFQNIQPNQYFTVGAKQSEPVTFSLQIPYQFNKPVTCRFVARSNQLSDGEENTLPVLSNRMLVTESQPLNMNGSGKKDFRFQKLLQSGDNETINNHLLTVEYSGNPAWYAVQALPYLVEYPYECAEQTFNRFYANALASKIANSSPRIKQIFEKWKSADTTALLSNLQKNQELKSVLLQETPWVLEGKNEVEQKKNIALLFDLVNMNRSLESALLQLQQMQLENGGFAWFKGGPDDRYITQYIITGIAHLRKLNSIPATVNEKINSIVNLALAYVDEKIKEDYNYLINRKMNLASDNLGYIQVQYLYLHSFFTNHNIPAGLFPAFNYYRRQAAQYWLGQNKYSQAMIALALFRTGDIQKAGNIMASIKQNAITNGEKGMYWKDNEGGYYWYQAPVEMQALMIEAFGEVDKDNNVVNDLKTWLLKQKQTTNWHTTKATAEACYALMLQGTDWLGTDRQIDIRLGNTVISSSDKADAGTGYFKKTIDGNFVKPEMGNISVSVGQSTPQYANLPSWGAVYWQYFEDIDRITPATTSLRISKKIFIEKNTDRGLVLDPVADNGVLKVGDKVKVRIVLQADRDMEYVHMKDMRASCMEPVNVLSEYKWQGGLSYYESTKDASTNFFFNSIPRGTYVFEYSLFITNTGNFSSGITTIQCMYAPEFTSHSEGIRINVE
ncbi:MAG TPA: alpha-2-macroglobulin family protein [Puia sp.]|nr:alpha-2-macroglobulin family protein [Puia sp.]